MNEEEFITEKYYRPYLVGYGGRTVQYKAWRALRPHVFGYGMTEDEARNSLAAIRTDVTTKAVGRGDAPIDITIGALILRDEKEMKKGLQEILGELGKALVQAKGKSSERVVIGTMDY